MVLAEDTTDRPVFDVEAIRRDFPALSLTPYGKPLAYLDNAASAQKPEAVIEAEARCYRECYANVHRGVHYLSAKATVAYEDARHKVQRFLGARQANEIVFVRGTTEAINLVAATYGRENVGEGDTGGGVHHVDVPMRRVARFAGYELGDIRLEGAVTTNQV